MNTDESVTTEKTTWRNLNHHFEILMCWDFLLYSLNQCLADHSECEGCDLCEDAAGMKYTAQMYFDLFMSGAPGEALEWFHNETNPERIERGIEEAEKMIAEREQRIAEKTARSTATPSSSGAPELVAVTELPPMRGKPYWLS